MREQKGLRNKGGGAHRARPPFLCLPSPRTPPSPRIPFSPPHSAPLSCCRIDCHDMEISVLLFASWADALGPAVTVTVPASATVRDVLEAVQARAEGRALPKPLVAVNHRYAKPESPVRAGDEIALIPPVAGG